VRGFDPGSKHPAFIDCRYREFTDDTVVSFRGSRESAIVHANPMAI
jgi:hypothetical protein